ncbi:MAG: hypothetical protein QRY74_03210 [Chlamydia sp.]
MAQTIVNFLIKSGSSLVIDPRVFNFEISDSSQAIFSDLMDQLNQAITTNNPANVQSILQKLNGWSQLAHITNGEQITRNGYNFNTGEYYTDEVESSEEIVTTTMNRYMAEYVDRLIRSIRSAGWDPIVDSVAQAAGSIQKVLDNPKIYLVLDYIRLGKLAADQAVIIKNATTQSKSLQQLLMVDYIDRGNELLYGQMKDLQTAIDLNQNSLSYLNSLQDLMNQKDPQQFIMQLQQLSTVNPSNLSLDTYSKFENETFNQQLGNISKFSAGQIRQYINTVQSLNLSSDTIQTLTEEQYSKLQGTIGGSFLNLATLQATDKSFNSQNNGINTIISNLDFLVNQLTNVSGGSANSIVQALQTIRSDFKTLSDQGITTAVINWVQDIGSNREGDYQRHLNDAIVASQSLNDSKREELRRVMFVFEEFYKSATNMLSRITQLIERMASSINK